MKSLNMGGDRFPLSKKSINDNIKEKIGNYAFGNLKKVNRKDSKTGKVKEYKIFVTKYVGRSDNNLRVEVKQQGLVKKVTKSGNPKYTHFKFTHLKKTAKTAYLMECQNYHDFGGSQKLDNIIHPARPKGYNKSTLSCSNKNCQD